MSKWMIQYQVLGEEHPRTQILEEESREQAVSLVFDDFFVDHPEGKVKLLQAMEVIDTRPAGAQEIGEKP